MQMKVSAHIAIDIWFYVMHTTEKGLSYNAFVTWEISFIYYHEPLKTLAYLTGEESLHDSTLVDLLTMFYGGHGCKKVQLTLCGSWTSFKVVCNLWRVKLKDGINYNTTLDCTEDRIISLMEVFASETEQLTNLQKFGPTIKLCLSKSSSSNSVAVISRCLKLRPETHEQELRLQL